jgi:hypothetical protein
VKVQIGGLNASYIFLLFGSNASKVVMLERKQRLGYARETLRLRKSPFGHACELMAAVVIVRRKEARKKRARLLWCHVERCSIARCDRIEIPWA